jgi:hypothetical protein
MLVHPSETAGSARGASLVIEVRPENSEKAVVFRSSSGFFPIGTGSTVELPAIRKALPDELRGITGAVGTQLKFQADNSGDLIKINQQVRALFKAGRLVLRQLLGSEFETTVGPLKQFVEAAFWSSIRREKPPIVEVSSPQDGLIPLVIPFELLPLLPYSSGAITNLDQLMVMLRGILGFSAVMSRPSPEGASGVANLTRNPSIPVKLFRESSLRFAQDEVRFFTARQDFQVEGPWPHAPAAPAEPAYEVAMHLCDPGLRFDGSKSNAVDQIQHFACHCNTLSANPNSHEFTLKPQDGAAFKVTLSDLIDAHSRILEERKSPRTLPLPLVFFNACGSAVFDVESVGSFVKLFVENRNRGFIGTQTPIPDPFAAAFSRCFYSNLLDGMDVGDALYAARWQMVKRNANVLGILYMHYGVPELSINRTRADPPLPGHTLAARAMSKEGRN